MSQKWRCIYKGAPDKWAVNGHAAASWNTFDKRVWERGEYKLTLTNLFAEGRRRTGRPPPGKITTYRVVVEGPEGEVLRLEGHDHYALVKEAREKS